MNSSLWIRVALVVILIANAWGTEWLDAAYLFLAGVLTSTIIDDYIDNRKDRQ